MSEDPEINLTVHRRLAARFFNETWELLDKPDRSGDDDLRMIHMAHASRMHWEFAGTPRNRSVGEWQISRVYSVLGMTAPALYHAENSLRIAMESALPPFQLGYSYEAIARAKAIAGDGTAGEYLAKAEELLAGVDDREDHALLEADLAIVSNMLAK
jgi:hypothetical protein